MSDTVKVNKFHSFKIPKVLLSSTKNILRMLRHTSKLTLVISKPQKKLGRGAKQFYLIRTEYISLKSSLQTENRVLKYRPIRLRKKFQQKSLPKANDK